ncbi:sacsin N-terminal ATP-binding-like domain-containing protein, partial [Bathymodiolus thermophilus thioautotrophic gill symbiont]
MNTNSFKSEIELLIKEQKNTYNSIHRILADYKHEKQTNDDYKGRQLLELLQNADDEKSIEVLIRLDIENKILTIANKGEECKPFSIDGIRSLMLANLSSKTNGQSIGNKGLGFRSIVNWSDEISILTNGIKLCFSQKIIKKYYEDLTTPEQRKNTQEERQLADGEIPMAVLAIPEIQEMCNKDWTTTINIQYKDNDLEDIRNQIKTIKAEVLLFLKHLQSIEIDTDNEKTIIKKPVDEWIIKNDFGEVPNEYLENDKNNEYALTIAHNKQLTNSGNDYLFAYFPTKIKINLPFIVHGTFELNSSRNQLIDNPKNKFIVKKLVAFIIETALSLKQDEANYQALKFLQYEYKNDLSEWGFYEEINKAIEEKKIYPCLDNKYRKKADIVYSNDFAKFINDNGFIEDIPYLLKLPDEQKLLNKLILDGFNTISKKGIGLVNLKIKKNCVRTEFICHLINNNYENDLPLLTDKNNELINLGDDIYEPATHDFLLPDYVHIQFINQKLFDLMEKKYEDSPKDWQGFANLKPYNKVEIFRKVITSTNSELEKTGTKPIDLIKSMTSFLYKNYSNSITISDQKIQLLDKEGKLQSAKNLYLSKTYPSGELTEELFGTIFNNSDFLADIDIYELGNDRQKIEDFFLWLGLNKYTKIVENEETKLMLTDGDSYRQVTATLASIARFDEIQRLPVENTIAWLILDKKYTEYVKNVLASYFFRYKKNITIRNTVSLQLESLFKDYLISDNNKINNLVNDKCVDYGHSLFKSNNIYKADIDSLLLKLGAVEKFSELSFENIEQVLASLLEKDPKGKLAQKIYLESFSGHKVEKLNDNICLFAKKGSEVGYFSKNEVYYAGGIKFPKEYTDTLAIFDYPKRNVQEVIGFFGVKDISEIQLEIKKAEVSNINDEFQTYFQEIKPYILAYRIKDLTNKQDEEAKKLDKIKITLCQNITCQIDREYTLSDYDYLINNEDYLIKISAEKLDTIRQKYDFYTVFGDILGLVFDLENTDKFKDCIKDSQANIKRDIKEHIGNHAIDEARELLGIASDFYNFWHKIYELKEKEYTDNHNNNLQYINQELELNIKDGQIKYEDLTGKENAGIVIKIFKQLNIKVKDFNNRQTNKIDFSKYHTEKLEHYFNDNQKYFEQNLYDYCNKGTRRSDFINLKNKYKAPCIQDDFKERLEVDYQSICEEFIKKEFEFKLSKTQ